VARLLHSLVDPLPSATGAGLVLLGDGQGVRQIAGIGAADTWDAAQLDCLCGPLVEAMTRDDVIIVDPFDPA